LVLLDRKNVARIGVGNRICKGICREICRRICRGIGEGIVLRDGFDWIGLYFFGFVFEKVLLERYVSD
jgi:hypothetical protein